jgi:hypothetical protein
MKMTMASSEQAPRWEWVAQMARGHMRQQQQMPGVLADALVLEALE